jgi:hypothetical protein
LAVAQPREVSHDLVEDPARRRRITMTRPASATALSTPWLTPHSVAQSSISLSLHHKLYSALFTVNIAE